MTVTLTQNERVGRALEALKSGLARFVEAEFEHQFPGQGHARAKQYMEQRPMHNPNAAVAVDSPISEWDVAALVALMEASWNVVFRPRLGKLGKTIRSRAIELNEFRHRWAHQKPMTEFEATHAIQGVVLLLRDIGAPESTEIEALSATPDLRQPHAPEPAADTISQTLPSGTPEDAPARREVEQLRTRGLELTSEIGRTRRVLLVWFFAWLAGDAGIVFAGRSIALRGTSLWLVIPGCVLAAVLTFGLTMRLAYATSRRRFDAFPEASTEQRRILDRLRELQQQELQREEEELPDIPVAEHMLAGMADSEISDPFLAYGMLSAATSPKLALMIRAQVREKFYPALLRQALTWWREERDQVDTYVRSHWREILASADKIETEYHEEFNFTVDMDGCRRIATWAVRHKLDEVRHHIPDLPPVSGPVTPRDPAVEHLARILRIWGGHKYELWLPKAHAYSAVSERPAEPPAQDLGPLTARLERVVGSGAARGLTRAQRKSALQAEFGTIVQELQAAGMSAEDIERLTTRLNAEGDGMLRNHDPRGTPDT